MNNIINEIRKKQDEIILMVNSTFESIINEVSQMEQSSIKNNNEYEQIYPITNIATFKGQKVIAVTINENRITTPTWKKVVFHILQDAIKNETYKEKLITLSDKVLGRTRTRLSTKSEDMRSPLKITDNLYIETHYDTETLLRLLLQILDEISYDYSSIKISIRHQKNTLY